jgi:hypothetical protein
MDMRNTNNGGEKAFFNIWSIASPFAPADEILFSK